MTWKGQDSISIIAGCHCIHHWKHFENKTIILWSDCTFPASVLIYLSKNLCLCLYATPLRIDLLRWRLPSFFRWTNTRHSLHIDAPLTLYWRATYTILTRDSRHYEAPLTPCWRYNHAIVTHHSRHLDTPLSPSWRATHAFIMLNSHQLDIKVDTSLTIDTSLIFILLRQSLHIDP